MSGARPALIVFCREPIAGRTKTRLIGKLTPAAAAALAGAFIRDAMAKAASVRPSRLVIAGSSGDDDARARPYFRRLAREFDAEIVEQGRGSLGARIARSLAPYANQGALLIGTDTPTLPAALLKRSVSLLGRSRVVIAPSLDGGYYAIGVRGAIPPIFSAVAWGSGGVMRASLARLKRARVAYALGPAWYDVDRWSDVMLLAAHLRLLARAPRGPHPCPATAAIMRRLGLLGDGG